MSASEVLSRWSLVFVCSSICACGIGYNESTDFAPRRPGPARAPKPAAALEIVPEGATPHCEYQCIGTVLHVVSAALIGQVASGDTFGRKRSAECANLLREQAAAVGGDGIYDLYWPERVRLAVCAARVFVCKGEKT